MQFCTAALRTNALGLFHQSLRPSRPPPRSLLRAPMASSSPSGKPYGAGQPEFTVPGLAPGSPWNQKSITQKYPPLTTDLDADVCIVGAGIAGLSCALELAKAGQKVVVLESRVRGAGQTGRTTAHIMTWFDDYYSKLINMHGLDTAKLVAESQRAAVDWVEDITVAESIQCDFTWVDGILYPHEPSEVSTLQKELEAAHRVGLTDTKMVYLGGGPEVGGITQALLFPKNGEFHPLKYLDGLAEAIVRRGGRIFEGTKAWSTEGECVETEDGKKVHCKHIVLATNSPINHNLAVHSRQAAYRSYVVGLLVPKESFARKDYWSTADPYNYVRAADEWDEKNYMVIVGGEDHHTGCNPSRDPCVALEAHARSHWSAAGEVVLRWSGQVMEPHDMLYLHGLDPFKPGTNTYIITGDSGQGMTGGTIGAKVVTDLILGRPNRYAEIYSPSRIPPAKSVPSLVTEEGGVVTASFVERALPKITLSYEVEPGHGRIVQTASDNKVALYCDDNGNKHAFSAVCPHLGCIVHWNEMEKQWDCPCHGSNFSATGDVINGPAKAPLKKLEW